MSERRLPRVHHGIASAGPPACRAVVTPIGRILPPKLGKRHHRAESQVFKNPPGEALRATCLPTTGAISSGAEVPIGRVAKTIKELGARVSRGRRAFDYPTDLTKVSPLSAAVIDTSSLPAATPQSKGMDRQPRLVFDRPSGPGSLTTHPVINPVQELASQGKPLAPNQIDWLKQKVAQEGD